MPSPVPHKKEVEEPVKLTLPQALNFVIDGKRITKLDWEDESSYGLLKDGLLKICIKGKIYDWIISEADLIGIDWIVLPEEKMN
jgi:hypothetical protein